MTLKSSCSFIFLSIKDVFSESPASLSISLFLLLVRAIVLRTIHRRSDVTCANYACGWQANMATRKPLHNSHSFDTESSEGGRELFEACRNGDVTKVRRIVNVNSNVNLRDTAGRKSSPLHFAAGKPTR